MGNSPTSTSPSSSARFAAAAAATDASEAGAVTSDGKEVDVTYDLIEGGFCPPPSVIGLSVKSNGGGAERSLGNTAASAADREAVARPPPLVSDSGVVSQQEMAAVDDLLAQTPVPPPVPPPLPPEEDDGNEEEEEELGRGIDGLTDSSSSVDNLRLGEEASETGSAVVNVDSASLGEGDVGVASAVGGSRPTIGGLTIAEYEGSPRRYRPRMSEVPPGGEASSNRSPASSSLRSVGRGGGASLTPSGGRTSRSRAGRAGPSSSPGGISSARPPGFPQRVVTQQPPQQQQQQASSSSHSSPSSTSSDSSRKGKPPGGGGGGGPSPASARPSQGAANNSPSSHQSTSEGSELSGQPATSVRQGQPDPRRPHNAEGVASGAEALLKFDEIGTSEVLPAAAAELRGQAPVQHAGGTPASAAQGYNYQYEFSETRKVLDEFFKTPKEGTENQSADTAAMENEEDVVRKREEDFGDLKYTLRRRTAANDTADSYIGQRLAATEGAEQPQQPQQIGNARVLKNDIATPSEAAMRSQFLTHHQRLKLSSIEAQQQQAPLRVGLSPLDQPLVSIGDISSAAASRGQIVQPTAQQPGAGGASSLSSSSALTSGSNSSVGGGDTGYATLNSPEASRVQHASSVSAQGGTAKAQQQQSLHQLHNSVGAAAATAQGRLGLLDHGGSFGLPAEASRNFTLSPETTDCDSADLESEVSVNEGSFHSSGPRLHTSMPVLEDGLSSGHASDLEEDVVYSR